ncbi:MAG: hypothetical protein K1X39_14055 [Thermoflexales bacterium]|nr:hypothetical protein [Thermoflexales bacterium]
MAKTKEQEPIQGQIPSNEDLAALAFMDELGKRSLQSIEETAKQLIGLDGVISGIYFGAVAIGGLPAVVVSSPLHRVLYIAPVALWLLSLVLAVLVLLPRTYSYNVHSPDDARATYGSLISTKHRRLLASLVVFVLSLAALLIALWEYMALVPLSAKP